MASSTSAFARSVVSRIAELTFSPGVIASFWFKLPDLGVVIGLAMICNLFAAALGGILIPLALDRFRADPARVAALALSHWAVQGTFRSVAEASVDLVAVLGQSAS